MRNALIIFFKQDRLQLPSPLSETMDGSEVMEGPCIGLYWRTAAKFVSGVASSNTEKLAGSV